ncbi:MAG: DUF3892 domain-containing protein [Balneolaceae bacterium]|nr:DUF3892 domain-containing protein [Balneolaceae bacterium]
MKRQITSTKKEDGVITAICNSTKWWSPVSTSQAIREIENKTYRYYVRIGFDEVDIHVVNGANGKYLRTDRDKTERNNLLELPDC